MLPTRWFSHRVFFVVIAAAAFLLAFIVSYVLTFGWPSDATLNARQKVFFVTTAAVLLGIHYSLGQRHAIFLPAFLVIAGPLWIGWPALMQGASSTILLILPAALGLWILLQITRAPARSVELGLLLVIAAIGLTWTALFARTFSIAQLALVLASALLAAMLARKKPPATVILIAATMLFVGLLSTLLLYSEAPFSALLFLSAGLILPPFAGVISRYTARQHPLWPSLLIASLLTAIAVSIAWIDAGASSIFDGASLDHGVVNIQAGKPYQKNYFALDALISMLITTSSATVVVDVQSPCPMP